jgi:hypothetical protein
VGADCNAELGLGVCVASEAGGDALLGAVLIIGRPWTDVDAPARRIISKGVDEASRAIVHAGTSGVVRVHGWVAGAAIHALPCVVRGEVIGLWWAGLHALVGGIISEGLVRSDRAHTNAGPCLIVSICVGSAGADACLAIALCVECRDGWACRNTSPRDIICEVARLAPRHAGLGDWISEEVGSSGAACNTDPSRIEAEEA